MSSVASAQLLELRGITHGYGGARARDVDGHAVLRDVSLDVDRGRIIGICGPSGSGKSTLLRLCAGLERPRRGTVTADGAPVWAGSRHPRLPRPGWAGALFQNPGASLDPNWRVGRILDEPYTVRGRARPGADERHRRRAAALAEVGLDGLRLDLRPRQLSGGQQQRVALARLLLSAPDLIVADEPTSALDVTNAAAVMHVLHRAARAGAGIVLASHDLPLLASLCDEVWRCEDCRLARVHLREEAAR